MEYDEDSGEADSYFRFFFDVYTDFIYRTKNEDYNIDDENDIAVITFSATVICQARMKLVDAAAVDGELALVPVESD